MKHKGLTIRLMLVLVLVLLLSLTGTVGAQDPTPNIESGSAEVLDSSPTLTVASPGSILIYGPSMSPPTNEQTLAQAAGHTVTVADAATWSTFTTAQFAAFDAIVFGDRTCATSPSLLSAAEANKAVWSAAITGPIYVQGTDPRYHIWRSQAQTMITSGINFAASGPGTGLYASLSCYYWNKPRYTTVSFLSQIGNFQAGPQEGCPAVVTIVDPIHPAMAGLTSAGLSNWGCTAHDFLLSFPSAFNVLATAIRPSDGADLPFIIAGVINQPPTADPNGPYLGAAGSPIAFDGTGSSDPDGDPLTYAWDFGDSNSGTGATPSHTYTAADIYDVCLTVNDGTVDSDEVCTFAVVYDPSAGFVTGGGWIDSPAGAYKPDTSLTGKANFGFVSKYKKGADTPTGNTEFQFHAADLNFHSDSYEWLVVTGSNYARFKGSGTINGMGAYKFMLWAGDGDPDTFHIKIWEEDELGVETVTYDNGFDQAIGGGSIVIHTKK